MTTEEKFIKRQKIWFFAGWLIMFFAVSSFFREDLVQMSDESLDILTMLVVGTVFLWFPYEYYFLRKKKNTLLRRPTSK